jgi:hypothetical protein
MANKSEIYSIVVPAQSPNLTAHTYSEIYGGSAGCTIVVNGVSVSIGAASNINVWVRTLSGGTGCYLLGENQNVYNPGTLL